MDRLVDVLTAVALVFGLLCALLVFVAFIAATFADIDADDIEQ